MNCFLEKMLFVWSLFSRGEQGRATEPFSPCCFPGQQPLRGRSSLRSLEFPQALPSINGLLQSFVT